MRGEAAEGVAVAVAGEAWGGKEGLGRDQNRGRGQRDSVESWAAVGGEIAAAAAADEEGRGPTLGGSMSSLQEFGCASTDVQMRHRCIVTTQEAERWAGPASLPLSNSFPNQERVGGSFVERSRKKTDPICSEEMLCSMGTPFPSCC